MCGIVGAVGDAVARLPRERCRRASDALRRRGPDDEGEYRSERAWLGHRRLSILDPSAAGHQPMRRGPLAIVYNGEIVNFRELRRGLDGPFDSDSDTEVLLRLFERDGPDCVLPLRGMFAFAVWNERTGELFAARDPLGIKPLYYAERPDGLLFASELRALRELLPDPTLDRGAVVDFLTHKCVPAPKSIYREARKLEPGHWLRVDATGRVERRRYWTPDADVRHRDADEALGLLTERLDAAVVDFTVSDVPVGVFLSGGIDSSSIVAALPGCRTFTVGFAERGADAEYAHAVARHFGTEHVEERVGAPDLEAALSELPGLYDEPFGDSSGWATHVVSRLARRTVKVALSGEGADELFSGYPRYARFLAPRPRGHALAGCLAPRLPPFSSLARSLARRSAAGLERWALLSGTFAPTQTRALLAPGWIERDYDPLWCWRTHWREDLEPVKRMQWLDLHTYLPDDLLVKADRASMAASLEVRPPFLDRPLVELALALDGALLRRADDVRGKWLLRRVLERRLPAAVIERPKQGFSMPVRRWIRERPELADAALARLARAGVLRSPRRPRLGGEQLWTLLALDRWLDDARAL